MEKREPKRPKTVPSEAIWNESNNEWGLGTKNKEDKAIGEWKWWLAPNGHLVCHTFFDENGNIKTFKRFHQNGEISQYGKVINGKYIERVWQRSTKPTTEGFPNYPKSVWKAIQRCGEIPVDYNVYDKEGNHLNPTIKESTLPSYSLDKTMIDTVKKTIYKNGKSALHRELTDSLLDSITSLSKEYEGLGEIFGDLQGDIVFHEGNLHIESLNCLAEMGIHVLFVDGNLTVDKSIRLYDDPCELLFVTGNVTTNHLVTSGELIIKGDLNVKSCLLGDYNDNMTTILGDVKAYFFHPDQYYFCMKKNISFKYAFGNTLSLNDNTNIGSFNYNKIKLSNFLSLLHPNIIENLNLEVKTYFDSLCEEEYLWEYLDRDQFLDYVGAGNSVFKIKQEETETILE